MSLLKAAERRNEIIKLLEASDQPVNATQLAERLSVSRQVIVGDIALIRAKGIEILATPRGYLSASAFKGEGSLFTGKIACQHSQSDTVTELNIIVDNGGEVVDVQVEHPALWHFDRRTVYSIAPRCHRFYEKNCLKRSGDAVFADRWRASAYTCL